jgi:hypothetical protein
LCYNFYMSFSVEVISLLLYLVQQLGIVLGVGAQTVLLVAHVIAARDGIIEKREEHVGKLVGYVLLFGLFCIISSGIAITLLHVSMGEGGIAESPAYIFKWALIAFVSLLTFLTLKHPLSHAVWQGLLGSQWYALFMLHMLAPAAYWEDMLALCLLWSVGFMFLWSVVVYSTRAHPRKPAKPEPVRAVAPPPMIKSEPVIPKPPSAPIIKIAPPPVPPAPLPVVSKEPLPMVVETKVAVSTPSMSVPSKPEPVPLAVPQKPPQKPVPQKPIEDPDAQVSLPAIRVMPQRPEQLDTQTRATVVQFSQQ